MEVEGLMKTLIEGELVCKQCVKLVVKAPKNKKELKSKIVKKIGKLMEQLGNVNSKRKTQK